MEITNLLKQQFTNYCIDGNLKEIKSIIEGPVWEVIQNKQELLKFAFIISCKFGYLNVVQYFLESKRVDIHVDDDAGFRFASKSEHFEIVDYLLTSSQLLEHSDINANKGEALLEACKKGDLKMLKFFLNHPEIKNPMDILKDEGFKESLKGNKNKVIEYMIFELNIEKNEIINNYLEEYPSPAVEKMFAVRESFNNLNKTLELDVSGITAKNKI